MPEHLECQVSLYYKKSAVTSNNYEKLVSKDMTTMDHHELQVHNEQISYLPFLPILEENLCRVPRSLPHVQF